MYVSGNGIITIRENQEADWTAGAGVSLLW